MSAVITLMLLYVVCTLCAVANSAVAETTEDLAYRFGYPLETHEVITEDGYRLGVHRIPRGVSCPQVAFPRKPVLLVHGLLQSSADWLLMGPNTALGFFLADECYDVWMLNNRGTVYSKSHETLSDQDGRFWQFSWHEMGFYDVPAAINHILDTTRAARLLYVGFSQGTTQWFVMQDLRKEYADRIDAAFLLAPVAFMSKSGGSVARHFAHHEPDLGVVSDALGFGELLPLDGVLANKSRAWCTSDSEMVSNTCSEMLYSLTGYNSTSENETSLKEILQVVPAGTSVMTVRHFAQTMNTGSFRMFDFGEPKKNQEVYGSPTPPAYTLSQNHVPVHLFYSLSDLFTNPDDFNSLLRHLSGVVEAFSVPATTFCHLDFTYCKQAWSLLYKPLAQSLSRY